jgi:hypothetical protein
MFFPNNKHHILYTKENYFRITLDILASLCFLMFQGKYKTPETLFWNYNFYKYFNSIILSKNHYFDFY